MQQKLLTSIIDKYQAVDRCISSAVHHWKLWENLSFFLAFSANNLAETGKWQLSVFFFQNFCVVLLSRIVKG